MILTPQYGYRSGCCYAPIKLGHRKVKNTNVKVQIWVCTKCDKKDVSLLEYTKDGPPRTNSVKPSFAPEIEPDL